MDDTQQFGMRESDEPVEVQIQRWDRFANVPNPILCRKDLAPGEKLLFGLIWAWNKKYPWYMESLPKIARRLGTGERMARSYAQRLIEKRLVEVRLVGRCHHYRIAADQLKATGEGECEAKESGNKLPQSECGSILPDRGENAATSCSESGNILQIDGRESGRILQPNPAGSCLPREVLRDSEIREREERRTALTFAEAEQRAAKELAGRPWERHVKAGDWKKGLEVWLLFEKGWRDKFDDVAVMEFGAMVDGVLSVKGPRKALERYKATNLREDLLRIGARCEKVRFTPIDARSIA